MLQIKMKVKDQHVKKAFVNCVVLPLQIYSTLIYKIILLKYALKLVKENSGLISMELMIYKKLEKRNMMI